MNDVAHEPTLRQSEARFRAAVAAVGVMWTNDASGRMKGAQPGWGELTGQSEAEYQDYGWAAAVHPDDAQPTIDGWNEAVVKRQTFEFEHRVRRHDGEWRNFSIRAVPVFEDGQIQEWVGVHIDVTDRATAMDALTASELRLRAATDAARLGIWTWQPEGDLVVWENARPYEIFGIDQADPPVNAARFATEFLHPDDREIFEAAARRTIEAGAPFVFDCRVRRVDGEQRWIEFTGKATTGITEPVKIIGTVLDITERKAVEDKLRSFAAELSETDRRKDEFLATLAHELRNPLAPIRNGLQLMRLSGYAAATVEKTTAMMERQLKQMVRLVDDLLDVSRINRDKLQLQKERVTLAAVLTQAVETSRPLIASSGHELVVAAPIEPVVLDADVTRLIQVFSNLVNNAAKFSDRGSRIWLTAEAANDAEVTVTVKDNGVGIPAEMLPKIFDMFVQVDGTLERSQGGLGIGLTLVKRLVELHGGAVEARSDGLGRGSEFIVRLPRVAANEESGKSPDQNEDNATAQHKVLVADDNVDAAESLVEMLRMMGNTVHQASDGLQAVEGAALFQPDVIVLDIGMPKLNGYEACRRIREQPWGKQATLIALTGWGQEEDKRRSKEAGFDHHLVKPIDPIVLEQLLLGLRRDNDASAKT